MLVAADLQRPAAVEQLKSLGNQLRRAGLSPREPKPTRSRCAHGGRACQRSGTTSSSSTPPAGCTSPKCRWMSCGDQRAPNRTEVFFVRDAMTGQDAVNVAPRRSTRPRSKRRHPDQARRRCPRRRRAGGARGHRQADGALLYTCQIDIPSDVEPGAFAFGSPTSTPARRMGGSNPHRRNRWQHHGRGASPSPTNHGRAAVYGRVVHRRRRRVRRR